MSLPVKTQGSALISPQLIKLKVTYHPCCDFTPHHAVTLNPCKCMLWLIPASQNHFTTKKQILSNTEKCQYSSWTHRGSQVSIAAM